MMIFLYKNVVSFRARVFDVALKNLITEIFIIIFILNLKYTNCILISNKEGFNNSQKKPINNHLVSYNNSTHLKNFEGNKQKNNFFNKNVIYKNIKYNENVYKPRDSKGYCFISNQCVTKSSYLNKNYKLKQLFSRNDLEFDLKSKISDNELESSSYYPTHTIVSGSESTKSLKYPSYPSELLLENPTDHKIPEKLNESTNSQQYKSYSLSDIDIGLIKNINCDRIIDVKSVFDEIYSDEESGKRYGLYKDNLVKFLADELRSGLFHKTLNLLYNRWKQMDSVALSRGFRVLFTELALKKKFSRVVETFLQILPNRFVTDIYSFEIATRSINRTYVDGWVLSVILISVMKSFGIEFFKRVSTFTDFKSSVNLDIFRDANPVFVRHFGAELHDTNKSRLQSMDLLFNTSIYSCFDSRNFPILLSLFYEKIMMNNSIKEYLTVGYKTKLDEKSIEHLSYVPHLDENQSQRSFDSMISNFISLLSDVNVSYDLNIIQKELSSIKLSDLSKVSDHDWSIYVILRHSLTNMFSTNEIVPTNLDKNGAREYGNTNYNSSNGTNGTTSNGTTSDRKDKDTSSRDRDRGSVNETIQLEPEQSTLLKELLRSRSNLSELEKYTDELYSLLSEKDLFTKNSVNKSSYTLEKTIDHIREYVRSGKEIGVSEVYSFMRMLLRYKISGSTAFNLLFMLIPNLTFSKWVHYHMFTCCLEHDFEKGNLGSIDELLQYMVKMDCKPDPGLYERFFGICNSVDKPLMVLKHFKIMSDNDIHWETWDRYTSQRKIRISFGMYEQIFISCMKTGKIKYAIKALLHLLEAMKGTYKHIPASAWNTFIKTTEFSKIDDELKAIIGQFSKNSENNPPDMTKQIFIEIPKQKSVLINEIERISEKYINDVN